MKRLIMLILFLMVLHPALAESRLADIQSYVVYYGSGRVDDLAHYDLAIVDPDTLTDAEIVALKAKGTRVVAYLSIGEVEPYRPWYEDGRVDKSWIFAENKNQGSYFINANEPGWRALMTTLAGEYLARGYEGVFLDTVDTVDVYPDTMDGMVALIRRLRMIYPDALLVQNRGFAILDRTAPYIDAVMLEDLTTSYNFDTDSYIGIGDENFEMAEQAQRVHQSTGVVVLSLDYAAPGDTATAQKAEQVALSYGFVPSVSVITLDDIPDYGLQSRRK